MKAPLRTPRLELVPATSSLYHLDLIGPGPLGRVLEAVVPEQWPPGELGPVRRDLAYLHRHTSGLEGWYAWYVVWTETKRTLCGIAGFNGPPLESGVVELGYSILPSHQGQGVATEAAEALREWAGQQDGVSCVAAIPEGFGAKASRRVLEKLGCKPATWELAPELPLGAWVCLRK